MKKKVLTSVLAIMLITILLTLTGCGAKDNSSKSDKSEKESTVPEFTIGDTTFKFDQDAVFNDLKYKKAEGLESSDSTMATYMVYKNTDVYDGNFVFRIVLMYQEGKTLDESMSDFERENNEKKTVNGIEWTVFDESAQGTRVIIYATEIDNKVYAIYTQAYTEANVDVIELSEKFMSGVTK